MNIPALDSPGEILQARVENLFEQRRTAVFRRTDRVMVYVMTAQWLSGILLAVFLSPYAWEGKVKTIHLHLYAATFLGGAISGLPVAFALWLPGRSVTRYTIAVGQMLWSALLIHLTGGRIETHFHVFGSLAILALYRDWKVLIPATVVVAADHFFRGLWWPESVYGIVNPEWWRFLEHAFWVVFIDVFLLMSCWRGTRDLLENCQHQVQVETLSERERGKAQALEHALSQIRVHSETLETRIRERTQTAEEARRKAEESLQQLQETQTQLLQSEKMAGLGQIAAGVAHEINNPVGFIMSNLGTLTSYVEVYKKLLSEYENLSRAFQSQGGNGDAAVIRARIQEICEKEDLPYISRDVDNLLSESSEGTQRIKEIVQGLKSFARLDEAQVKEASVNDCIETTLKVIANELKYKCQVEKKLGAVPLIRCYPGQLNQVFMNLLVNAAQAIPERGEVKIETTAEEDGVVVRISDTGTGIPPENLAKLFTPFFTTKPIGKGTGLGLSTCHGIVKKHGGTITVESHLGKGTTFTIRLPGGGGTILNE